MSFPSAKWVGFLRKYGPIPTNDNMYDEVIERALRRSKIAPIQLPALYLETILENFRSAEPRSVVLTGTAGDGKTYHCRQVWSAFGGTEDDWNRGEAIQRLKLQARELIIVKDLTELDEAEGNGLLQDMSEDLVSGKTHRLYLVAANHGQLMEKWRSAATTPAAQAVASAVEDLLVSGDAVSPIYKVSLYNLSAQSAATMLPKVLDQVLGHPAWADCATCSIKASGGACPILENRSRLLGADDQGLMKRRLVALAELSEQNGVHFPIRHLLLLTVNMLLGHPEAKDGLLTCGDVADVLASGTGHLASVYRNVFGENLATRRREATDVFEKLSRFGVGQETTNRIDGVLVYGADDSALRSDYARLVSGDAVYGASRAWQQEQQAYLEGSGEDEAAGGPFLGALRSQRQRLFFVLPDEPFQNSSLWELTVYRYAGLYLSLLQSIRARQQVPRNVLSLVVRGLNRVFTGMLLQNRDQIVLGTSGSHSQAKTSRLLAATISVPRSRGEEVSLQSHRHEQGAALSVSLVGSGDPTPVVLPLSLLRFEFLCRVAEGALPSSFSLECYEDILAYKSKLLSAVDQRKRSEAGPVETSEALFLEFIDVNSDGVALPQRVEVRFS